MELNPENKIRNDQRINLDHWLKVENIETDDYGTIYELIYDLSQSNDPDFTIMKCAEELNELSLVLLQYLNKKDNKKPKRQDIIDEIGDCQIRINMIIHLLEIDLEEEINKRISEKCNKFIKYIKSAEYKGGI